MTITNQDMIDEWAKVPIDIIQNFGDTGDFSRQHLLNPTLFSLLGNVRGKTILDAGCGQGYLSRLLVKEGAIVTGIEPGDNLIHYAREREQKEELGITYIKEDLSVWDPESKVFDIVVSNMVFMDIPDYQSAMKNCITALKSGGVFVFSILHPCFEAEEADTSKDPEQHHAPNWKDRSYIQVKEYFKEYTVRNIVGYSFHRTVSTYINFLIDQKCSIQKILEPQLEETIGKQYPHFERDVHVPSFLLIKAIRNI